MIPSAVAGLSSVGFSCVFLLIDVDPDTDEDDDDHSLLFPNPPLLFFLVNILNHYLKAFMFQVI